LNKEKNKKTKRNKYMTIEITKSSENPVAEFFSSPSNTPETDAVQHEGLLRTNPIPMQVVTANFARKLERERDEARHKLELCMAANSDVARIAKERDKAHKIAGRAIDDLGWFNETNAQRLQAELDQLKEGAK
jgi:hypothetical protein